MSTAERLGPVRVRQLTDDYQGGVSIKEVAARYETSEASVFKILKEHGVPTRPTGVNMMWLEEKHYRRAAR
jgi:Mor family transcriptional regulator